MGLLGPRQCGKTTLALQVAREQPDFDARTGYFDLEDPIALARLENPMAALRPLKGLVLMDEVQRRPDLFSTLRVLADRADRPARFLVLGSATRDMIRQSSETLAGRIGYLELTPFSLSEVGPAERERLFLRSGFPESYLAPDDAISALWRENFVRTFLERDIPSLGFGMAPASLGRFWRMLAHYHGQTFNSSEIGGSMGITHTTARRYADALASAFMVRQLLPWFENIGKRQVRSPKIYFRDSGIFHALLRIAAMEDLLVHPKLGAAWEGFALEETIRALELPDDAVYFWSVHNQAELDLLAFVDGKRVGFEFTYADAPRGTRGMRMAMEALRLDSLTVVYPGSTEYELDDQVRVAPIERIAAISPS